MAAGGGDASPLEEAVGSLSPGSGDGLCLVADHPEQWAVNPTVHMRNRIAPHRLSFEGFASVGRSADGAWDIAVKDDPRQPGRKELVEAMAAVVEDGARRYFAEVEPTPEMRRAPFGKDGFTARIDLLGAGGVNSMVVTEDRSGEVVGGLFTGTLWVDPRWRGHGLGAEIVWAAEQQADVKLRPIGHYTESGFQAVRRAYMLTVERHVAAGASARK